MGVSGIDLLSNILSEIKIRKPIELLGDEDHLLPLGQRQEKARSILNKTVFGDQEVALFSVGGHPLPWGGTAVKEALKTEDLFRKVFETYRTYGRVSSA